MALATQPLTEKEKETLRLIVRGYDAKSMAGELGISVHTVNERLRHARRKMEVSSSREAARKLAEVEGSAPHLLVAKQFGGAAALTSMTEGESPQGGQKAKIRFARKRGVFAVMSILLATLAVAALSQSGSTAASNAPATPSVEQAPVVDAARSWLDLVDANNWDASWKATSSTFQKQNSLALWTSVSNQMRAKLGPAHSRLFISEENVPAPPHGYQMVKFRTDYANKPGAIETVSLVSEDGRWKVVGCWIS